MNRKKTIPVQIDDITIGGNAPIVVQSMTDTPTADMDKTVEQIIELHDAGSELVRITVNTDEAAAAVPVIQKRLHEKQCLVPIVGDFHYNGHRLLTKYPECAKALSKYRINPGNSNDAGFCAFINIAKKYQKPIRIGVNGGSLDQGLLAKLMDENAKAKHPKPTHLITREALIASTLKSAKSAEQLGLSPDKIILSCKVSNVPELIGIYQALSERSDYALHLGVTESGQGSQGIVTSGVGIGALLAQGIGDTIRVSITPPPGSARCQEVIIAQQILQALNLRCFMPTIISCPGCGRTTSDTFRQLAADVDAYIQSRLPAWRKINANANNLTIAVMGCIVNGPGESKGADIGIYLPGRGEAQSAVVNIHGRQAAILRGANISEQFLALLEQYVNQES